MAGNGTSILLVEQNVHLALDVAQKAYILETGKLTLLEPSAELKKNEEVRRSYLGR